MKTKDLMDIQKGDMLYIGRYESSSCDVVINSVKVIDVHYNDNNIDVYCDNGDNYIIGKPKDGISFYCKKHGDVLELAGLVKADISNECIRLMSNQLSFEKTQFIGRCVRIKDNITIVRNTKKLPVTDTTVADLNDI